MLSLRRPCLVVILVASLAAPFAAAQVELQKFTAPVPHFGEVLGAAVAVDGDVIAISRNGADGEGLQDRGSVMVYRWSPSGWSLEQEVFAPDGAELDNFGACALRGDLLAVGALAADVEGTVDVGKLYLFHHDGSSWSHFQTLLPPGGAAGGYFGYSVGLDDDLLVAGAPGYVGDDIGRAYVFRRDGSTWSHEATLTTGQVDTAYASDVAVDGDVVIVGAPAEGNGRAHVYRYSASTWAVEDVLSDPSGVGWFINSPAFGHSVAVRGDLIAVGEPHATIDGKIQHGKALVFQRSGLEWIQETELLPPGGDYDWRFGVSVALSSERLVIGSPGATSLAGVGQGAAFVYRREAGAWTGPTSLSSALWSVWPSLGSAVAVDGPLVVAGNPMESLTGNAFQGSATVFSVMNPFWHYAGGGLAGVHGVPDLVGRGTFAPGSPTTLTLSDARPSAPVVVFLGFTPLYAPFKGGTLAPTPSLLLFGLSTDVSGGLTAGAPWPGGIPSGLTLWMHFWIQDPAGVFGWSAGNALSATQP